MFGTEAPGLSAEGALELISFRVDGQEYCLDIQDILEIRGWTPPSPIAHAPEFITGVVNLRGVVLPVMDLARRLGRRGLEPSVRNVVIVVQAAYGPVGLLVEAVCDNRIVARSEVQPAAAASGGVAPDFIQGFLPFERGMVTVLKLGQLLPGAELAAAVSAVEAA